MIYIYIYIDMSLLWCTICSVTALLLLFGLVLVIYQVPGILFFKSIYFKG